MKPNIYTNHHLIMAISSTILLLIGIISMAAPLRIVYADDSSDESQRDQSSPSSSDDSQTDQSSSQADDSSDRSQTDKSSSDESRSDHSSSSQQCPPGQFPKHGFCQTPEQKRKSEEFSNCLGGNALSAAGGALNGDPSGAASGVGGLFNCFKGVK